MASRLSHRKQINELRLHFVGIGGIGMSGIAAVFKNQGYQVSGSDLNESETTQKLRAMGIDVQIGHAAKNVSDVDVVVISSAVKGDNEEVLEAKKQRIPVIPRAEILGELMRGKKGVSVAGSHGKTTTTSMLSSIFHEAQLDPTVVIGGIVDSLGGNAKLGAGEYLIAEADESDGSFLFLPSTYAIITNIDNDHLDYYSNLEAIDDAFVRFVGKLPFYGCAVVCGEDVGVRRCLPKFTKPYVTYGLNDQWDYWVTDIQLQTMSSTFEVHSQEGLLGKIKIPLPGRHNVLNALSTVALSLELGLDFQIIARGLEKFSGVKRRFDIVWKDLDQKRAIIDDYGHHPTEIRETLTAARQFWDGRIKVIFQPHRFSRTRHCLDLFSAAFLDADEIWITDIYPAGEKPIAGIQETLMDRIRSTAKKNQTVEYVPDFEKAIGKLKESFQPGDLLICMGAGSITKLPSKVVSELRLGK